MKWLVIAVLVLAQQPAKTPTGGRAAKANGTQITNQADATKSQQKPALNPALDAQSTNTSVSPHDQVSAITKDSQRSESENNAHQEDLTIQRKLVSFTLLLVVVGFLQAGVMVLQWLTYRRQAGIMEQQRTTMQSQWATMQDQLGQMKDAGEQTNRMIEQVTAQVGHLETSANAAKRSADAANLNAHAVINSERPWVTFFAVDSRGTYSFRAGNVGRSPAKIISYACQILYLLPSNLPEEMSYGSEHVPKLDFLMPSRDLGDQDIEICTVDTNFLMWADQERAQRLNDRIEAIVVILKISYEDPVNPDSATKLHETKMCFDWTPGLDFKVSGPSTYNRHS